MALWKIWLLNTDLFCESLFIRLSATHYLLQSINVVQPSNKNNVVCSFICRNQHVLSMQFLSIPVPVYPCPLRNIVFPPLFLSLFFFFFYFPFTMPCRSVFAKAEDLKMWSNHLSFCFLTKILFPMAAWIFSANIRIGDRVLIWDVQCQFGNSVIQIFTHGVEERWLLWNRMKVRVV